MRQPALALCCAAACASLCLHAGRRLTDSHKPSQLDPALLRQAALHNNPFAVRSGVSRVELERAKRAAVSVICNALESKATSAEDIGRQYLTYGHRCARLWSRPFALWA